MDSGLAASAFALRGSADKSRRPGMTNGEYGAYRSTHTHADALPHAGAYDCFSAAMLSNIVAKTVLALSNARLHPGLRYGGCHKP